MKKYFYLILIIMFISFLYFNFFKENTYNSYLKNIYYNFLGIFNRNQTMRVNYDSEELEIIELKNSISELKELTKINTVLAEYEIINASVVSRSLAGWFNTLIIDKGLNDGIEEGDAVTNHEALVGTVVEVMNDSSIVRLITNNQNKVSAKILDQDITYGIIYEYKNNYLTMQGLKNNKINEGSKVVTTGMSYLYPAGIYIGEVANVKIDDLGLSTTVLIKTPVDFNNILFVSVLKR